jgi:hypothetical protein
MSETKYSSTDTRSQPVGQVGVEQLPQLARGDAIGNEAKIIKEGSWCL